MGTSFFVQCKFWKLFKDYLKAFNNEFLWLRKHFLEKMLLQVYRKVCFRATIVFHIYQQPTRRSNIDYHGYTMFFSKANIRNISETHPTKAYIK